MADMRNLGEILQRAGAGFQGNLAQFDATRAQQQMMTEDREEKRIAKLQALDLDRKRAMVKDGQKALYFLDNNRPDLALETANNRLSQIERLGGDPTDTLQMIELLKTNPAQARQELELFTRAGEIEWDVKQLISTADKIKQDELDIKRAEYEANYGTPAPGAAPAVGAAGGGVGGVPPAGGPAMGGIKGAQLRIEQQRAAIDAQKAARDAAEFAAKQADIPEQWMKPYLDATQAELKATQNAAQLSQLAADFEAAEVLPAGLRATVNEVAKKVFGEQDTVTTLRERFSGARNSQVMKNLPPGVASDRDIELAMSGYPGDNAPKESITSFLRGQVKVQALEAAYERFKVEYIDQNRSLRGVGNAWKQEAPRVFEGIKAEIGKPLNRSYSIEQIDAELAKRKATP